MKSLLSQIKMIALVVVAMLMLASTQSLAQDFQRVYGTPFDNAFGKVIQDGTNYYVLGQDEPAEGVLPRATVTRLDANGILQWTLSLPIASVWNDAVLIPGGDLLVVGTTTPIAQPSQSLIGRVTSSGGGSFSWLKSYDWPGMEAFTHIVHNPMPQNMAYHYYVLGRERQTGAPQTTDDVVLLNLDENGLFNWKKVFVSTADDQYYRDLEALPNGNMLIVGEEGATGYIFEVDNTGAMQNGVQISNPPMAFMDVTRALTGDIYAVANTVAGQAHLLKFDPTLFMQWDVQIPELSTVSQVWEGFFGEIYVTGRGNFGSTSRDVVVKITDAGTPTVNWVKYPNTGNGFIGGSAWWLNSAQIAFTDARSVPGGLGQNDAFISVSDPEMATCSVSTEMANLVFYDPLPDSPAFLNIEFQDILPPTILVADSMTWQQQQVCSTGPCTAEFTFTVNCGVVTFTDQSVVPGTPSWSWTFPGGTPSSSPAQNPTVTYPVCGTYQVCLTATGSTPFTSCSNTVCHMVTIEDNEPPFANCNGAGIVTLDASCIANVFPAQIGSGTDNCQLLSLTVSPNVFNSCGIFPIALTATDWCGNADICFTLVEVKDNLPPTIMCPPNIQLACWPASTGVATATDNCPGVVVTFTDAVSGMLPCDATITRTWKATDACGNMSTCVQTITVIDNVPPIIMCPPSVQKTCGPAGTGPNDTGFATASDNCSTPTVTFTDDVSGLMPCDASIARTWKATDACGNMSTCVQTITVHDNIAPVLTNCPPSVTVTGVQGPNGICTANVQVVSPTVSDNCNLTPTLTNSFNSTADASGVYPNGITTVTWTATDGCGNVGNCSFTVMVECATCPCPEGSTPGPNNVQNADFSLGNTLFNSSYSYTAANTVEGQYWVGNTPQTFNGGFVACADHSATGTGNMMIVNGDINISNPNVWMQTITVNPNTNYSFSCWISSLVSASPANLQFYINGNIPLGNGFQATSSTCAWQEFCETWNSGPGTSPFTVLIRIVNLNTAPGGNDFALDDISFQECSVTQPDPCCTDSIAFFTAAANVQTFGTLGDCHINFAATGLNDCMQISYLWGDDPLATWTAPVGNNVSVSHTYAGAGTYFVCYRIEEVDANGVVCWDFEKCDSVPVLCACDSSLSNDGLTGYFPFYNNANDFSATGINGNVIGATTTAGHDAAVNSAYHFNGTSDWIDCGTNNRGVSTAVTVGAWVRTGEQVNGQWVVGKYKYEEDKGYVLGIGDGASLHIGQVSFGGRDGTNGTGAGHNSGWSNTLVNDSTWHCLVGKAVDNTWSVYVDGVLENSMPGSTSGGIATSLNIPLTIGFQIPASPVWMNGDIDNVVLYNRALSDEEIVCFCDGVLPPDTCTCLGFEDLNFITDFGQVFVDCNNQPPVMLTCPADTIGTFFFHGDLHCSDSCATAVDWNILDANGVSHFSGSASVHLIGGGVYHFDLPSIAYGSFPIPGDYHIVLTGHCGSSVCECVINFNVPNCDTCVCAADPVQLTHGDSTYTLGCNIHGAQDLLLGCPATNVTIGGFFGCTNSVTGELCDETDVWWELDRPGILTSFTGMTTNFPTFFFPASDVSAPGLYCLTRWTVCPGSTDTCVCKIRWVQLPCDTCCTSLDDFCQRVENAVTIDVDNAQCKATLNIGNFNGCDDYLEWVQWDNNLPPVFGPFVTGDMPMHTYSGSGIHEICYLAIERDSNGLICFEKLVCDTIELECNCCTDSIAFFTAAPNIETFGTLGDCHINFAATGMDDCWQISYHWGDLPPFVWEGPYGNNASVSHTYSGPGTYSVCYRLEEVDEDSTICWEYVKCEDVLVLCEDTCLVPPNGMVGWWPMDDQDGDLSIVDIAGNHDGLPQLGGSVGSPNGPSPVPGKVAGALHFIGVPGATYAEAPNVPDLNFGAGNFSIDAWINTDMGTQTEPIVDKLGNLNSGYSFSIQGPSPLASYVTLLVGTIGGPVQYLQGPAILPGQWNLVAVTVNTQINVATFYVCNSSGFSQSQVAISGTTNASNTQPLLIGHSSNPHWNIMIDELEIFNRVLDSSEVYSICNADTLGKCKPDTCLCSNLPVDVESGFISSVVGDELYQFQPLGLLDDCDLVTWLWNDGTPESQSIGRQVVEHSFPESAIYTVCMSVTRTGVIGPACTEQFCSELTEAGAVLETSSIRLFPNPTTGELTLEFSGTTPKAGVVQILDIYGRLLILETLLTGEKAHSLSIATLSAGMYFVRVMEDGVPVWTKKVVKQ